MSPLQARRILLARQGLSLLPSKNDAMRAMVAVQTQYAQSLGQALAARSSASEPGYERIAPDGPLVKSWTLRGTVHTHTREDYRLVLSAVGPRKYDRFRGYVQQHLGMTDDQYEDMELAVLRELEEGPLTRNELHQRVPDLARTPFTGWGSDVKGLAYLGKLSFVDSGFALVQDFEPVPNAMVKLARRYFASYGPATPQDFAAWTGCLTIDTRPAIDAIKDELCPVKIEGFTAHRYVVGEVEKEEPREASLLAKFDPITLAHRDKSLLFPSEHLSRIFRIAGQIEAVFLLRGEPSGTWRVSRKGKGIVAKLEPWRMPLKRELRALEREADRLAKSLGESRAELSFNEVNRRP